ncbi:MAG: hypothetical protein U0167_05935 [bacterium]
MDVLLNEILYDPEGADGGYEYVELVAAPGAASDGSLAGWVVETGNGSTGEWRVAWTGASGQRLQGGLFVLGESGVEPRPNVVTELDLQNGPDACRLRSPSGEVDVVGWGSPLPRGFFEGAAAVDVSGQSLARLPDGVDTDRNDVDFRPAAPTPGGFNSPESLAVVERADLPPAGLSPGTPWDFRWRIRNAGRAAWTGAVRVVCALHPGETLAKVEIDAAPGLGPGAVVELAATAVPPQGAHLPRSDPPSPEVGALWRGTGADLAVSEVYSRPPPEETEWVELVSLADAPLALSALRLHDATGTGGALGGVLSPFQFALVTADTGRFVARWGRPAGALLVQLAPWPALNHTGSPEELAERVDVEAGGEGIAAATLPGGIAQGVSWERISLRLPGEALSSWGPCLDPRGAAPGGRTAATPTWRCPAPPARSSCGRCRSAPRWTARLSWCCGPSAAPRRAR